MGVVCPCGSTLIHTSRAFEVAHAGKGRSLDQACWRLSSVSHQSSQPSRRCSSNAGASRRGSCDRRDQVRTWASGNGGESLEGAAILKQEPNGSSLPGFQPDKGLEADLVQDIMADIRNLAIPALGSSLADPLMSLIDTACVGQLGPVQLGALGPNSAIFAFIFQIAKLLSDGLVLAVSLGSASLVLMEVFSRQLLGAMGAPAELMKPALTYLQIRAVSVPAVMIIMIGYGACLGQQDAKTPLAIFLAAGFLNIVGDWVLTLHLGWGVAGAAIATVASQYVGAALFLRVLYMRGNRAAQSRREVPEGTPRGPLLLLSWRGLPTSERLEPFWKMAKSILLRCICGMMVYTMVAYVATSLGTLEIAAHQVAMQVFWFLSTAPEPLSLSAQSLIARDVGVNPKRVQLMARLLLLFSLVFGAFLACLTALVPTVFGRFLSADLAVRARFLQLTPQSMLCQQLCAAAVVLDGISIGSGDFAYLPRMNFLIMVTVGSALAVCRSLGGGRGGVWWCLTLFFGARIVYHLQHVVRHWDQHVLGLAGLGSGYAHAA